MEYLLTKNDKLVLAKLKELNSKVSSGVKIVLGDLERDLYPKLSEYEIQDSLKRLKDFRVVSLDNKILTGNEPQLIGLKVHHKHDDSRLGEIISELPNDKVRVRWDSGSVSCYKFSNLVVVEPAAPKSRLEELEMRLEQVKKEAYSQALRQLNELTSDYAEQKQIGYQRTLRDLHQQELKQRQPQIQHLQSKIVQLKRQQEACSMKQWKPGDEFVEGYRWGKLIKPIQSRQTSRAWLAKVNGYDCIVSLDYIEPPPAEENGQLLLFGELATVVDEPPDPDDFSTVDEYNLAFEQWQSRS